MSTRKIRLVSGGEDSCPKCGSPDSIHRTFSDVIEFRELELDIDGLQTSVCNSCGYIWENAKQTAQNRALMRSTYAAKRDAIRTSQGLLSGPNIAEIRDGLKLTQRDAATLFGGGFNAFNKYESGEVLQSFAMDRLLRLSKLIGPPVVSFLRSVESPPEFIVIAAPSSTNMAISAIDLHTIARGISYSVLPQSNQYSVPDATTINPISAGSSQMIRAQLY